jgi:adenosylcobinamide kinase / adenosylcobinamide-phosphate guanylyltransferase
MDVRMVGTGGRGGWPRPDCRCASCARAAAAGRRRAPAQVLVDGVLRLGPGSASGVSGPPPGYQVGRMPGGWTVAGPDGGRLLVADGSGVTPQPPPGTGPYDIVLLDLLDDPAQLGSLRRRGLVRAGTVAAVLHADHRVSAEEELARRCRFWGVIAPGDGDVLTTAPGTTGPGTTGPGTTGPGTTGPGTTGPGTTGPGLATAGPPRRVLVLGGARSGKSRHAELRLAAEPLVTYLAAGPYPPRTRPGADPEWAERVAAHRSRRPPWWRTVESLDAARTLRGSSGAVLFDGAGTWLAAVMQESGTWAADGEQDDEGAARRMAAKADELVEAWRQTRARVVAVSDEVGSSVHPPTRAGRLFRDQLGWLNQRLAAESEETVLMVAGRPLPLPP